MGLCGHSKGPRSSFNSRAAEPHSSTRAPLPLGWRGLREQEGENAEKEESSSLCLHQESPLGGQKAAAGDGRVTNTGLIRERLPLKNEG